MRKVLLIIAYIPFFVVGQKFYLIGDAGEPKSPDPNLTLLASRFEGATQDDVLIFLGDNLYPKGLPAPEDPQRMEMEQKLIPQLEVMKAFPGKAYIIPGNHDWAQGKSYGWEYARYMEDFVQDYFEGDENVFLPAQSCPGPVEINLNDKVTLIIINSQYYLHPWDKPGDTDDCANKSSLEALESLKEIIELNKGKHIIMASHHPMFTFGEHHGNFSFKEHLFPFTAINKGLYIPLPVIGSIHPFYRRFIGDIQDNTNLKYRAIMKQILEAMNQTENVVYTSGHEHSLQYIKKSGHHFIVSGSGSKTTHVKQGKSSLFAKSQQGFAVVDVQETGQVSLTFWGAEEGQLYEEELYAKLVTSTLNEQAQPDFQDSTVMVVASERYQAGKGKRRWMGVNYRDVWATPIEVPVFDLANERGGLKVLKKGGGMQTKSLRLQAGDGKQYVLRSIEKYPEKAIPLALQKTFAQDIVQDQISSAHPYGAFIVPTLAEAAGIYHTNPQVVWIPEDPLLGEYMKNFAGTLALYEERPNKQAAKLSYFGEGKDVEGTLDVLEKLQEDNDHTVDQNFVVRNRLFDLWIGDWDRHDDQWRWSESKGEYGNVYRPIPRDRDQAFFVNDGIIMKWAARKWALPKIEGFDEEVNWAPGLGDNARFFDRTFMSEPDWGDWEGQIAHLQNVLTDQVIDEAISGWPEAVQELTRADVKSGLMARRADMPRYARELYLFLAKEVEIVGSDKHELFTIERIDKRQVKVTMRKRKKAGDLEQVLYERLFLAEETKEIRLYGRDGEDVFEYKGVPDGDIKIRVIGGTDKDRFINATDNKLKQLTVYDRKKSTRFEGNSQGIQKLSDDGAVNFYDRKAFQYDKLFPLVNASINPDDNIMLGGGFSFTKHGWRKFPYAAKHDASASVAVGTGAFNLEYEGDYKNVFGKWGLNTYGAWYRPFQVNNFFGLGNETQFFMDRNFDPEDDDPIDYYRTRIKSLYVDVNLTRPLGGKGSFYVGPGLRRMKVEQTENRFLASEFAIDGDDTFSQHDYYSGRMGVRVDTRNDMIIPTSGMTANAEIEHYEAITDYSTSFTRLSGEWAFYLSTRIPARVTLASRVGAAANFGDFEFFNANILGGRSNLRGYRRTRFYGESSFYHNLDLRIKLFSFRSYLFPAQLGLLGFYDTGRVWLDGESSATWHNGKGFGLWVSPVNMFLINVNYGIGEDENILNVSFDFFF